MGQIYFILVCFLPCLYSVGGFKNCVEIEEFKAFKERFQDMERHQKVLMSQLKSQDEKIRALKTKLANSKPSIDNAIEDKILTTRKTLDINQRDTRLISNTAQNTVAFYAYLSKAESSPGPHHTLIFDVTKTNVGSGYNSFSGIFTVPLNGIYAFSASTRCPPNSYGTFELVKNNEVVGAFFLDSGHNSENRFSSTTIVLSVEQGDVVYVRTSATNTFHGSVVSDHAGRSSFTGWRI